MFAIMPQTPPTFSFGRPGQVQAHRPTFSSPLSSSPVRASSVSPPPHHHHQQTTSQPLSPCNQNHLNTFPWHRETQSSPIPAPSIFGSMSGSNTENSSSSSSSSSKFRFASRNPRPNPVLKRREDAQEGRRRLFFQNVRQRQDDKRWEMRGGEDELLKLEHHRLTRERHQAKEREVLGLAADPDLMAQEEEEMLLLRMRQQHGEGVGIGMGMDVDMDALMADAIAQQEAAEVDALVEGLEMESGAQAHQFSDDDEDYDGLLLDFIQQQEQQQQSGLGGGGCHEQDVEMS